jgi:hypothetical protein
MGGMCLRGALFHCLEIRCGSSPFQAGFWYYRDMASNPQTSPVVLYSRLVVELVDSTGEVERREFTLVPSRRADFKSGLLDETAPLARALLGHHAGETVPYPVGDLLEVRILSVAEGQNGELPDAAGKRRADVRRAAAQSEITNQMIFSTASGSKWGDYEVDMEKLLDEADDQEETKEG